MNKQQIFEYYSAVAGQILEYSQGREVAGAFWDGTYDKRPNILQYKNDIIQMAKNGVTSFHLSVEHWSNAMALASDNYDKLRTGWDVIIDIDSKLGLEEAKTAAEMICAVLRKYGIKNYGIKFSGRRGFHISLPWIMFPREIDYTPSAQKYPDVPRAVSGFIREKIRDDLMQHLVKTKGAKTLMEMIGEVPETFSPFFFIEIEKDWGSRHMFRAPFSLNEKTWMASVPVKDIKSFDAETAKPEYAVSRLKNYPEFLRGQEGEAQDLVLDAIDWATMQKKEEKKTAKRTVTWDRKIDERHFPPCIKNILEGLQDGRKRSIFILANFLRIMNWSDQEIEQALFAWNEKNRPPLPRATVVMQLRRVQRVQMTPANCPPDGDMYYTDTRICRPDSVCKQGTQKIAIKNPVVYPFRLMKKERKEKKDIARIKRGYSCGICGKELKNMQSLNQHKARMHGYVSEEEI